MSKKIFLVDGSNHAFRVFFAMPRMTAGGVNTGALLGFANMLRSFEKEHQPDHVVVVAAGLSRNTISNWRRRSMPSVSHLDAVLNALGYRLAILPCDNSGVVGGADGKPTAEHAQRVKSDETNKERENATNEQYG